MDKMRERQQCPLCLKTGLVNYLQSYQINLEEAVVLCENKQCPYPLAQSSSVSSTFTRSFEEILLTRGHEEGPRVSDSQLALQTKVASHMRKVGQRLQKDAVGIQTGSPQLKKTSKSHSLKAREPPKKRGTTPASHRQTGSNSFSQLNLVQNGSQSFQNGKSFSPKGHIPGSTNGLTRSTWSSCNGSDGGSDKDSSFDSFESNSTSSNSSIGDTTSFTEQAKYPAFQFGQSKPRLSPQSMPNLQNSSSQLVTSNGHSDQHGDVAHNSQAFTSLGSAEQRLNNPSLAVGERSQFLPHNETKNSCRGKPFTSESSAHESEAEHIVDPSPNTRDDENTESSLNKLQKDKILGSELNVSSAREKSDILLRYPQVFPQWRNKDALCWLDVILCLAVHNETLKTRVFSENFDRNSLMYKLLSAHNQACQLLQKSKGNCSKNGCSPHTEMVTPENEINGSINQALLPGRSSNENIIPKEARDKDKNCTHVNVKTDVENMLDLVREEVWELLKLRLKCKKGQNESPVFALPLLLKETQAVDELFRMSYNFQYKCTVCGVDDVTDHSNTLPTFPDVVDDFRICDPQHGKKCLNCGNPKDARTMVYKKLPECLLMHFTNGLPEISWSELQFGFHGNIYTVTGVVQYVNNPDHFIAWLRNPSENRWLKCDDLRPTACRYRATEPNFASSQIHIVMWEQLQFKPRICRQVAMDKEEDPRSATQMLQKKIERKHLKDRTSSCSNFSNKINSLANLEENGLKNVVSHKKKGTWLVKCADPVRSVESPCSTLSTESADSFLLPNFISSTPVSTSVLRPIPKAVCSVPEIGMNKDDNQLVLPDVGAIPTKTYDTFVDSEETVKLPDLSKGVKAKVENRIIRDHVVNDLEDTNDISNKPASQICGQKTLIKPSTVFCVPKKSSKVTESSNGHSISFNKRKTMETKIDENDKNIHTEMVQQHSKREASVEPDELDGKCSNVPGVKKRKKGKAGLEGEKVVDTPGPVDDTNELTDNNGSECDKPSKIEKETNSSKQTSRFKVPIRFARKASISKDAFFTLESNNSKADLSACSTPVSVSASSSPGLRGNLTFLNSVKQYLLSRTTGRSEQKFKFEGLNLKSVTSVNKSAGLSELELPVSSCVSTNGTVPMVTSTSFSDSLETGSICSGTSASKASTGALVTDLIERLEQSPLEDTLNPVTLKRKLENFSHSNPKRSLNDDTNDLDTISSGNVSLKENSDTRSRKKLPGGKNMKLVRKLVKRAERAKTEEKDTKEQFDIGKNDRQNLIAEEIDSKCDGSKTKCDTETVLQDLYEALNIPFNSVNSTMSDIMTDVDDILNFVNVGDVLPDQHLDDRPSSCFAGSILGNQKHHDCWIRRPGRNSA